MKAESKKVTPKYFSSVGRRKRSIARVRLFNAKGQSIVNGKPIDEFFFGAKSKRWKRPFEVVDKIGHYYVTAVINGGGKIGQLEAFAHALSRALVKHNPDYRKALRDAGLMTRDPRERERRKYGLAHSARAKKQSPKR